MKKPIFFIAFLPLITLISCHEKGLLQPPLTYTMSPEDGDTLHTPWPTFYFKSLDGADSYHLQVDDTTTFETPVRENSQVQDTFYQIKDSLRDGKYYWRVRSREDGLYGQWSEVRSFYILTNPYAVTGYTPVIGYARDVWVEGNIAYVAASEGGISIFDVADPGVPLFVSRWDDTHKQYVARSLFKEEGGSYLYLADDDGGLEMLNVAQVDSIYFLYNSWNRNCEDVWGTKLNDTLFLFVADRDDGLYSFREGPNYLVELSHISTEAKLYGVLVRDTLAYLAVGELGLEIVDISDPLHMTPVATLPLVGRARDVKVMGDLAFVASSTEGLHIVSVSNPSSPVLLATIDLRGYSMKVAATDSVVFVACGSGGLRIVDVSDPSEPKLIGHVDTGYSYGVFIKGDYIYVASREGLYTVRRIF